jgi:hypothetical protein
MPFITIERIIINMFSLKTSL